MTSRFIQTIDTHFRDTANMTGLAQMSEPVRRAILSVDRSKFISPEQNPNAELDAALPIDCGQTISQPFIVALMTELLMPCHGDRVLEIGTGSGYQAAVLSRLVKWVYSIEVIEVLAEQAKQRLFEQGFNNISVQCSDGYKGWSECAPYDGIIVTAAVPEIPQSLLDQLAEGGRLVLPLGEPYMGQQLTVIERLPNGNNSRQVLPVSFVPFTRL